MSNVWPSWRTALRIARREANRSKGRSALVIAMIALPAVALSFAAATYDMAMLTGAEQADQTMGTADARIQWPTGQPIMQMPDPENGWDSATIPGPNRGEPVEGDAPGTEAQLREALPAQSTVLPVRRGSVAVKTPAGLGQSDAVLVDASSPLTRGYVDVLDGRAPATATEVALTEHAMDWLDARIGDPVTIHVGQDTRDYTVVGQVEFPSMLAPVLLFDYVSDEPTVDDEAPAGGETALGAWFSERDTFWLVDTPEPISWGRVVELNELGMLVASRAVFLNPPPDELVPLVQRWRTGGVYIDTEELAIGVLVAGLALLEVVLLAGPAFAVSARRRQRQLALVAANGGTPAHVRRIVLADGVVLGLAGAGTGIALGIAAAFTARPWVEELLLHARAGGYRVFPEALAAIAGLAVVTGLLAAMVPAFVTARQSVVAALAGRRGTTRSRKRWIATGLVMIGIGAAVTALGAVSVNASIMLAGLVLAELGLVVCTPALVGLIARAGRVLPLAPRIALRDAGRNRAAAAPAISAVMAAVAGSVMIGMIVDSDREHARTTWPQNLPTGTVTLYLDSGEQRQVSAATIEQTIRNILPVSQMYTVGWPGCPLRPGTDDFCTIQVLYNDLCPQMAQWQAGDISEEMRKAAAANPNCDARASYSSGMGLVSDGSALATLTGASGEDLRRAREMLAAGGVVVRSPLQITDGQVTLAIVRPDPDAPSGPDQQPGSPWRMVGAVHVPAGHTVTTMTVPGYLLTTGLGPGTAVFSPEVVERAGMSLAFEQLIGATTRPPSGEERERFYAAMQALGIGGTIESGLPNQFDPMLLVLAGAAGLITLGAAGIGTGLAAADGRADLSTLAAVGASPRLRRGLSVSQSSVIAGLGSLLGSLAGLGAAYSVIQANNQQDWLRLWPGTPVEPVLPWLTLAVVLVAVPLVAILGAGLLTRSRLPVERRL